MDSGRSPLLRPAMEWGDVGSKIAQLSGLPDKLYEKAFEFAYSVVKSEIELQRGLEDELRKLRDLERRISARLTDAEERRLITDDEVLLWLRNLRDVALDAEDVIDEFETRLHRSRAPPRRAEEDSPGTRKRPWYAILSAPSPLILFRRRVAMEIKEINERFGQISEQRKSLRLGAREAPSRERAVEAPPSTAFFREEPLVLGRDGDRDKIVGLLLPGEQGAASYNNSNNGLLVVPIFGMAGLGKTTLARYVFNDQRVVKHFKNYMIWICATEGFDVVRMTREILESLTGEPCGLSNFNLMQCRVREQLMGKPFLLVLDDVREEGPLYWEHLQVCLLAGGGGGRVVITTRSEEVARRMGTIPGGCEGLNGLSHAHCLQLFGERAFPDGGLDRFPNLREIGVQIASKCQGSPLAAISLGGLLHNETDETEWNSVLNEAVEFSQTQNDILPKLKLIYDHLPLRLKRCFAFCAIFPDGYLFDKDVLVRMWIAEGFIERRGNRRLETMGSKYFDELLWRSFFQISDRTQKQKVRYIIPSLFHEVAQSVSKHECLRMVDNEQKRHDDSENVRHTLLLCRRGNAMTFTGFHEYKRLRTFSVKGDDRVSIRKLPSDPFLKLRCIRVLDLSDSTITELPDSIGELKLLRYLGLCRTWIKWLPESVATLCNLQTLDLNDCYKLCKLPEGMSNLVNLRHLGLHLDLHRGSNIISMPPGIGKLTSLETLSRFIVGTRNGCGLSEIQNLGLRGELWISKLENVASQGDAGGANLHNKQYISTLTLQWSDHGQSTVQHVNRVDVIEYLQPPTQLKHLCVDNYDGVTVPSWLSNRSLTNLVSLRLLHCKRWESIPSLGQLPLLEELFLEGMHSVRSMAYQFPESGSAAPHFTALKKLTLSDFPALQRWSLVEGMMPQLSELYVSHCPLLVGVPHLPTSLTKLAIKSCPALLTLPTLSKLQDLTVEACDWEVLGMVSNLTSLSSLTISQLSSLQDIKESFFKDLTVLKRLEIARCKKLVSIAGNEGLRGLTSLEYLRISSCPELTVISSNGLPPDLKDVRLYNCHKLVSIAGNEGLRGLTSLAYLQISSCPELAVISSNGLPPNLKDVRLCHCRKLTSLAWDLNNLSSLQHMEVHGIPRVMSLPREGISPSLQYLAISGCPFLAWRCQKDKGIDWPKIKGIFYIEIDFKVLSVERGN